jgi:hypothetical protein
MRLFFRLYTFLLFFYLFSIQAFSQSLPVGTVAVEDFYRRTQLEGKWNSNVSFTIRPLMSNSETTNNSLLYPDSSSKNYDLLNFGKTEWKSKNKQFMATVLPMNYQVLYNSKIPYGWNDAAMIPAKGFQHFFSAGIYARYKFLSIQLKPELVHTSNPDFEGFTKEHYDVIAARYHDFYNFIDLPQRFGTNDYSKITWGQSSLRLNFDPISFGISNENLWWGPGTRNSLLMSNSAPGFKHLTLNTTRPVNTPIGSFESQLVAGKLEGSKFPPMLPARSYLYDSLYVPKPDDWRYFSGLAFTLQPKWVPGLFIGFSRSFQVYSEDLGRRLGDYLPIFSPLQKVKADEPINKRDQYSSLFLRWVWPEERAELYFEYGRSSPSGNLRDLSLEPENDRAYIFGLRKQYPFFNRKDESFHINFELTQLQQSTVKSVLEARAWYINKYVRHGYTHQGQALGAGIGPGGNSQTIDFTWHKGLKSIGLQMERYVHNNDFYFYAYVDSQDWRRHWVDMSLGLYSNWNYKNLLINASVKHTSFINYQWYLLQEDPNQYFTNGLDKFNMQVQMGLTYRF